MAGTGQILLVTKKSFYQIYATERRDPRFLEMLARNDTQAAELRQAHEENLRACEEVAGFLSREGVSWREEQATSRVDDGTCSLVLTVGGDGTLLEASHWLRDTPIAGINSRPEHSVGWFCTATRWNFASRLAPILEGIEPVRLLDRCAVMVGGQELPPPALNDFLYTAVNPASTTVYALELDGHREVQQSSGVWVSTPAGSSAAILAAGGTRVPLDAGLLQFTVREIYRRHASYLLLRGLFTRGFRIVNLMPAAAVWIDGGQIRHDLCYGDSIEPVLSSHPLKIHLSGGGEACDAC